VLVDQEFFDPDEGAGQDVRAAFPFLDVDPVDARLLPRIRRDQIAIAGEIRAAAGAAAGEASLMHVARSAKHSSIVLSNDPHAVGLGRRYGIEVRGTLYVMHRAFSANVLTSAEAWDYYRTLIESGRRPPPLTRPQLYRYLRTGTDPRAK
jgi:hypothetical protein